MTTELPLKQVRVLDLSRLLPGPACTWYLQGLGAEVVKIEAPPMGDYLRHMPPFQSDGVGAWFASINAGKKSVALDLKKPQDHEAFLKLLPHFDVLIESFRPGVMARLGLEPQGLLERHPRLVIASITGFGQSGPMAQAPGHDLGYCALAGALSLSARHDGVPDNPGVQVADFAGGALTSALSIVSALVGVQHTGRGRWLDLSMTDATLAMLAPIVASTAVGGTSPQPGEDTLTGGMPNYRCYTCSDGKLISFAPLEPKFWAAFCAILGEEISADHQALEELFSTRTRDEWEALLMEACAVPVLEIDEISSHPHHQARGTFIGEGPALRVCPPFPGAAEVAMRPVPQMGEHTNEVLQAAGIEPSASEEKP